LDLDWILESKIFNFRIWIGYGIHEKASNWIRIAKFPYTCTTDPQPLQPGSTAGATYFCDTDYDDIVSLDYRKKSAVRTALENLIQKESHADGKDEHFLSLATLESSCDLSERGCNPTKGRRPGLGIDVLHKTAIATKLNHAAT